LYLFPTIKDEPLPKPDSLPAEGADFLNRKDAKAQRKIRELMMFRTAAHSSACLNSFRRGSCLHETHLFAFFPFFLLVQKETKKTPAIDYSPMAGSSFVRQCAG
jgi:hypothetical protein